MGFGGRAFTKPLPFSLGTNGHQITAGTIDTVGVSYAQQMGMTIYRNDVPWAGVSGTAAVIEGLPGVYSATNIGWVQYVVSGMKAANLTPLVVVTTAQNPGLCPVLATALTSGSVYTSIHVTPLAYAIASGNSIQAINPVGQVVQTVTATSGMAIGASGTLSVSSFTANFTTPSGSWIYDTAWPASTPQHLANAMAYLVAQSGLQGLHWEILNEPDGGLWNVIPTLYTQMMKLVYPAMKAADPTCIIHGFCIEHMSPPGWGDGIDWVTPCYAAGAGNGVTHDVVSVHDYNYDASILVDCAPDAINIWGYQFWQNLANFRAFMLTHGDTSPIWWTECNWPSTSQGVMTPQLQAQFLQNLLCTLAGYDPINAVQFSQYLKAFLIYDQTGTSGNWGLIPNDLNTPNPAVAILTELVTGH